LQEKAMDNAGVQNKQSTGTSSVTSAMWDPFWFMREMLGWGGPAGAPSFEIKETKDAYVCKLDAKLSLPEQADAAHVKAELHDGELTLVVPKAAAAARQPRRTTNRATKKDGRGSAGRARRRSGRATTRRA
jgi:Hsp20/alpha crystallin family protein